MKRLWLMLTLTGCAGQWSSTATALAPVTVSAIGADCAVTHVNLARDTTWVEANPLLGPRPKPAKLWGACALAVVATVVAADRIPGMRMPILVTVGLVEVWMVAYNLGVVKVPLWR